MAEGQLGDDDEFPQFQSSGHDILAELGQVVLLRAAHFLDETVDPRALQEPGYLPAVLVRQMAPQRLVLQPAEVELTAHHCTEQRVVAGIEQIESRIGTILVLDGAGQFVKFVPPGARIGDGGKELQVPAIGGFQQFPQGRA
jgi:hypothetical protein